MTFESADFFALCLHSSSWAKINQQRGMTRFFSPLFLGLWRWYCVDLSPPSTVSTSFPILQVMLWHFGSCPVSCLFILLVYFHHDSENFLTPLETERKSLCVVEYVECLTTNTKKLLPRLSRGRRVLYFWKVVRFWGRPLINVTIRRCYFGFSFQRYQNHKESPTLALCKKWNLGAFRNQPSCSSCVCR